MSSWKHPRTGIIRLVILCFGKWVKTCVFNEKLLLAWTCVFCVRIFFPPLWVVWELFTAATAALLSCRLQCLALSFFSAALTPPWKERGCVCVCVKSTPGRKGDLQPSTGRPQNPHIPQLLFLHLSIPASSLPSTLDPEGRDVSVSGPSDVTLGNLRF